MLSDSQRAGLKALTDTALDRVGGQENAVNVTGRIRRPTAFSEYRNVNEPQRYVPFDIAIELDQFMARVGQEPLFLVRHAELCGYAVRRLQPMPRVDDMQALVALGKESAEALGAGYAALADGHVSESERVNLLRQLRDVANATDVLLARFAGSEEGGQ